MFLLIVSGLNFSTEHRAMSGKKWNNVWGKLFHNGHSCPEWSETFFWHHKSFDIISFRHHKTQKHSVNIGLSCSDFSLFEQFNRQFTHAVFLIFKTLRCVWLKRSFWMLVDICLSKFDIYQGTVASNSFKSHTNFWCLDFFVMSGLKFTLSDATSFLPDNLPGLKKYIRTWTLVRGCLQEIQNEIYPKLTFALPWKKLFLHYFSLKAQRQL